MDKMAEAYMSLAAAPAPDKGTEMPFPSSLRRSTKLFDKVPPASHGLQYTLHRAALFRLACLACIKRYVKATTLKMTIHCAQSNEPCIREHLSSWTRS